MLSLVRAPLAGRTWQCLACLVAVLSLVFGSQGCRNYYTQLDEARRLAAELRLEFTRAADASNRAVMADTDESSSAFAREAEKGMQNVERGVAALLSVLRSLSLPKELQLFEGFGKQLVEYRELDRTILALAVENTNLDAQRLAFGPARKAADDFRDALGAIASSIPPKDRCDGEGLIAKATLSLREIQILHAPHIAERTDAAMTSMEQEMDAREASAGSAVTSLTQMVPQAGRPALTRAASALDRFHDISRQIVALSRRNSDVRSLELSLLEKPALTAACDESLRVLQDTLAKEDIKATR